MRGIVNIIIGVIFIIGGLTGKMVLIFTNSGMALAGVGALLIGLGIFRIIQAKRGQG